MAKNWKDSAGIVMVSGAFKYARPPTPLTSVAVGGDNPLIVPTDDLGGGDKEWETLLVKRNSKTVFFGMQAQNNPSSLYHVHVREGMLMCVELC